MTRSTFTNQLIKDLLNVNSNYLMIDDGGKTHACSTFKRACEVIDSVDDVQINVVYKYTATKLGWLYLTMCNDGTEQLVDHTANEYLERVVMRLLNKYDTGLKNM